MHKLRSPFIAAVRRSPRNFGVSSSILQCHSEACLVSTGSERPLLLPSRPIQPTLFAFETAPVTVFTPSANRDAFQKCTRDTLGSRSSYGVSYRQCDGRQKYSSRMLSERLWLYRPACLVIVGPCGCDGPLLCNAEIFTLLTFVRAVHGGVPELSRCLMLTLLSSFGGLRVL